MIVTPVPLPLAGCVGLDVFADVAGLLSGSDGLARGLEGDAGAIAGNKSSSGCKFGDDVGLSLGVDSGGVCSDGLPVGEFRGDGVGVRVGEVGASIDGLRSPMSGRFGRPVSGSVGICGAGCGADTYGSGG